MNKSILLDEDDINNQVLVAIVNEALNIIQYVVCSNYDPNKKFGEQWDYGHYFVSDGNGNSALTSALNYLHRMESEV